MELRLLINKPGEVRQWPPDCTLITPDGEPIENVDIRDVKFTADHTTVLFRIRCTAHLALDQEDKP